MALSAPEGKSAGAPYVELAREHLLDLFTAAQWLTDDPQQAFGLTLASVRDGSRRFAEFNGGVDLRNWLLGIMCGLCEADGDGDREWGGADIGGGWPSPVCAVEAEPLATLVRGLPGRLRQPLVLCDITGLAYRDIAKALRVPVGAVRSRVWRARQALFTSMETEPGAGPRRAAQRPANE
jgi:hypothetical protein